MKTTLLLVVLPITALAAQNGVGGPAASTGSSATGACPRNGACPLGTISAMNPTTLTAADLVAAIDEERMAHDVYVVAAQRWNLPLFLNIAAAETRHAGAFDALAASAKFTLPPAQAGAYSTADIQRLHDQLLPLVNSSLATALKAGALIEETSIVDVRRCMRAATDEPTRNVLAQLDRASRQHLSAFVRHLQSLGETYRPHILSPEEFATAMVAQPMPGRGPGYRGGR